MALHFHVILATAVPNHRRTYWVHFNLANTGNYIRCVSKCRFLNPSVGGIASAAGQKLFTSLPNREIAVNDMILDLSIKNCIAARTFYIR
jgi:hypothetical protein